MKDIAYVKINFKDEPRILSIFSKNSHLEFILTDKKGTLIEHILLSDDGKAVFKTMNGKG